MKNKLHFILTAVLLFFCGSSLYAASQQYLPAVKVTPSSFRKTAENKNISQKFTFPAVPPKAGYSMVLKADVRLAMQKGAGWSPYLIININNKTLGPLTSTHTSRLLRRGEKMNTSNHGKLNWCYGNAWMLFFADENAADSDRRLVTPRGEGFVYYWDITDSVNMLEIGAEGRIEKDTPNQMTLTCTYVTKLMPQRKVDFLVKNIEVIYVANDEMRKAAGVKVEKQPKLPARESLQGSGFKLEATANGSLQITDGKECFFVESFYSYPARPAMKFNSLSNKGAVGEANWKVNVKKLNSNTLRITAGNQKIQLVRTLTNKKNHIAVVDKLSNKTNNIIGLKYFNRLSVNEFPSAGFKMAGHGEPGNVTFHGASNPTIFMGHNKFAVGIVAEDTLSRAHMSMQGSNNQVQFGSDGLGLSGKESVSLEWSIYPVKGSYFDFINKVRRDWGVIKTLPGNGVWGGAIADTDLKAAFVPFSPWWNFADYRGKDLDEYFKLTRTRYNSRKHAYPQATLLAMLECNLVPFDVRTVPFGEEIPTRKVGNISDPRASGHVEGVRYGFALSKELTAKLEKVLPYADSVIRDAEGRMLVDNYYEVYPYINIMVQPEINNQRYKDLLAGVDAGLYAKAGGIYVDQWQPHKIGGTSLHKWDGRTVVLDAAGNIKQKIYSYLYKGASARAGFINYVKSKNVPLVFNGQPTSREETIASRGAVYAFQEMENDSVDPRAYMTGKPPEFKWQTMNHLGTPWGLGLRTFLYNPKGSQPDITAELIMKGTITALRNGIMYCIYTPWLSNDHANKSNLSYEMFNLMYPITPEELNEGFIRGTERTITAISGKFKVGGSKKPVVHGFDNRTQRKAAIGNAAVISGTPGAWDVTIKLKDWCEIAIITVEN